MSKSDSEYNTEFGDEPYEADSDGDPEYEPPRQKQKKCLITTYFPTTRKLLGSDTSTVCNNDNYSEAVPSDTTKTTSVSSSASTTNTDNDDDGTSSSTSVEPGPSGSLPCLLEKLRNTALFDGKFYILDNIVGNNVVSTCQICKAIIKGPASSTSNFLKHLRKRHPGIVKVYENYKLQRKQAQTKNSETLHNVTVTSGNVSSKVSLKFKQTTLSQSQKKNSQKEFDIKITKFIINTMSPTSIVEDESFKALFSQLDVSIISRRSLVRRIEEQYCKNNEYIRMQLTNVNFVCTTADIWSGKRRSFLGMTCHWLDDHLQRHSVALACRRFGGTHSYDRITDVLEDIHSQFGLDNEKIVATITDNGSNFVKAFKENGIEFIENEGEDEEDSETEYDSEDLELNDEVNLTRLPKHIRCSSHTLSLLATTDVNNAINSNTILRSRHEKIIQKCNSLWQKAARPKSAEIIQDVIGHTLSYPSVTRWNSLYDSMTQILKDKSKLKVLFEKLELKECFKESEIQYLEEYCSTLKPVAETLDFLQGENNTFYGYILPSIVSLKVKLDKLKNETTLKNTKFILDKMIIGLDKRFGTYFALNEKFEEAAIAAFTIPSIKLRWVSALQRFNLNIDKDSVQKIILEKVKKEIPSNCGLRPEELDVQDQPHQVKDFFDFGDSNQAQIIGQNQTRKDTPNTKLDLEVLKYLDDPRTELDMLKDFPFIKYLFVKYNTALPSSAPVERLFSFATYINSPRRNGLSDKLFEKLVVLKANKSLNF